jgi:predicted AlkP superfamily pyrophosphatase or phosphodiesterase
MRNTTTGDDPGHLRDPDRLATFRQPESEGPLQVMRPAFFLIAGVAVVGCGARSAPHPAGAPTLVVLVTVDQLRSDYLARFQPQFTGGLGRLLRDGAWFPNAFHDHAITSTAPGHASAWSGRYPRRTGIVSNDRGVPDPTARLLESEGPGASPFRFRGEMFFDWVEAQGRGARALSVSRKDRGAILSIGRARESVYWFAPEGRFTTSTYYVDTLPAWVRAFNARRLPERMAGRVWDLVLPDSAYPEPDSVPFESGGHDFLFPHVMAADSVRAARTLLDWPWMDGLTLEFALAGVEALGLGRGPGTDVLAVSLSATDAVGHRFGPDSREIHDQVLRIDGLLGAFLDSLARLRDPSRIVVALTSDHGVAPFPELHAARTDASAGHVSLRPQLVAVRRVLADHGIPAGAFRLESAQLWVDREAIAAGGIPLDSLVAAFAEQVRAERGVARVDLVRSLATADTVRDVIARRWVHALSPDVPIELVITLEPHWVWGLEWDAQHGTPWDYDAHVPMVFYGTPFHAGRFDDTVSAVDLAPTLAAALGIPIRGDVDGVVRWEAIRRAAGR